MNESCIAIIPARGGSRRLKRKNILEVYGRPMLAWVVDACWESGCMDEVYVSSEDEEILEVASALGCKGLRRPDELADDIVPKMEVVRHAYNQVQKHHGQAALNRIAVLQANSPELRSSDLKRGMELMNEHGLWEVLSVDEDLVQNAAFRIIKSSAIFNTFLSAHVGVVVTPYLDIHTAGDLDTMLARHPTKEAFMAARSS
ncbi:MAG: NTP transferase domain-containing protein [Verrucomicrobia bacterium]|nr:NTP transferase domain-containing protein [Verrucomicrobiota bacterium]